VVYTVWLRRDGQDLRVVIERICLLLCDRGACRAGKLRQSLLGRTSGPYVRPGMGPPIGLPASEWRSRRVGPAREAQPDHQADCRLRVEFVTETARRTGLPRRRSCIGLGDAESMRLPEDVGLISVATGFNAAATFFRSCQLTNRIAARIRCTTQVWTVECGQVASIASGRRTQRPRRTHHTDAA
jgi:hypothetical protein